eukprot:COSAG02_NODE_2476_length_8733_cov_9.786542_3_plen_51_part_00
MVKRCLWRGIDVALVLLVRGHLYRCSRHTGRLKLPAHRLQALVVAGHLNR